MISVGNDIVDLMSPPNLKRGGDTRLKKKILTRAEEVMVDRARQPDLLLWGLWSAKETAFKAVKKTCPEARFLPRTFEVLPVCDDSSHGRVRTPFGEVSVSWEFCADYIHCIGFSGRLPSERDRGQAIFCGLGRLTEKQTLCPETESSVTRGQAEASLAGFLKEPRENLCIRRLEKGPPRVFLNGHDAGICLSLSHDSRFAAWAFLHESG